MNPLKIGLTLAINVFFTLSLAHAGGDKVGGGGGAFVCRNSQNQVIDAKLIDLYEGSQRYGLTMLNLQGNLNDVFDQIMVKVYRVYESKMASAIDKEARRLISQMIKKPGIILSKTADFDLVVQPSSCAGGTIGFEQLAFYGPDGRLNVSQDIYDHLSLSGKVALLFHEAIYKYARVNYNAPTSTQSRRAVAYFFSSLSIDDYPDDAVDLQPSVSEYSYACDYSVKLGRGVLVDVFEDGEVKKGSKWQSADSYSSVSYGTTLENAFMGVPIPHFERQPYNDPDGDSVIFSFLVCSRFNPESPNLADNPCKVPMTREICRKLK